MKKLLIILGLTCLSLAVVFGILIPKVDEYNLYYGCKNHRDSVEAGINLLIGKGYKPLTGYDNYELGNAEILDTMKNFNKAERKMTAFVMDEITTAEVNLFVLQNTPEHIVVADTFMIRMYTKEDTLSSRAPITMYDYWDRNFYKTPDISDCSKEFQQNFKKYCFDHLLSYDFKYLGNSYLLQTAYQELKDSVILFANHDQLKFEEYMNRYSDSDNKFSIEIVAELSDEQIIRNIDNLEYLFSYLPLDRYMRLTKKLPPMVMYKYSYGHTQDSIAEKLVLKSLANNEKFSLDQIVWIYADDVIDYKKFLSYVRNASTVRLTEKDDWFRYVEESDKGEMLKMLIHRVVTEDDYLAVAKFLQGYPEYMELLRKTHACCGS